MHNKHIWSKQSRQAMDENLMNSTEISCCPLWLKLNRVHANPHFPIINAFKSHLWSFPKWRTQILFTVWLLYQISIQVVYLLNSKVLIMKGFCKRRGYDGSINWQPKVVAQVKIETQMFVALNIFNLSQFVGQSDRSFESEPFHVLRPAG